MLFMLLSIEFCQYFSVNNLFLYHTHRAELLQMIRSSTATNVHMFNAVILFKDSD